MREIKVELDMRLAGLRARRLQVLALRSAETDWQNRRPAERPTCPVCGMPLVLRGKHQR